MKKIKFPPELLFDPEAAADYCHKHGRIKELEPIISTNPITSYRYSINVLRGRFLKGEKAILTDPTLSAFYAVNVLQDRWTKAERRIAKSMAATAYYIKGIYGIENMETIFNDAVENNRILKYVAENYRKVIKKKKIDFITFI